MQIHCPNLCSLLLLLVSRTVSCEGLGVQNDENFEANSKGSSRIFTTSNNPDDVRLLVFSDPANPRDAREIHIGNMTSLRLSQLVPGKIIIVIDGWLSANIGAALIKNGYLKQGFNNIILVDHTKLTSSNILPFNIGLSYVGAVGNVPIIGENIANLIEFLHDKNIISGFDQVHIVGISLGAHIAGSAGNYLQKKYTSKVARITALEPTGVLANFLKKNKLNKNYATFVDVIHTDIEAMGTYESLGHVDFFINGGLGFKIPGCKKYGPLYFLCGHSAASVIFYKSIIKENLFVGCDCGDVSPKFTTACARKPVCKAPTIAGQSCPPTAKGDLFVKTSVKLDAFKYVAALVLAGDSLDINVIS